MWFLRTKAECRTVTYCDLNPNGWDSCQTELDLWQRPAPEWPPESGVPQQPIRGLGRIFHVLGMPGLAWHAWLSNSYFNIRCNSASSTHRHPVSVLRCRTMWSCWTRPLRLQRQGQRQMVDQQQQGLRRRRSRQEVVEKRHQNALKTSDLFGMFGKMQKMLRKCVHLLGF